MSDSRTIAAENLDMIGKYSEALHERIEKYARRVATTYDDKGLRKAMIDTMVMLGLTSPMPAHGSKKRGKGYKLNAATTLYLKVLADNMELRGM